MSKPRELGNTSPFHTFSSVASPTWRWRGKDIIVPEPVARVPVCPAAVDYLLAAESVPPLILDQDGLNGSRFGVKVNPVRRRVFLSSETLTGTFRSFGSE